MLGWVGKNINDKESYELLWEKKRPNNIPRDLHGEKKNTALNDGAILLYS